ncbi:MAG: hypothetical protein C4341_08720 [Armatimonadota bacterium]
MISALVTAVSLVVNVFSFGQLSQFGDAAFAPGGWIRVEVRHADPWVAAMLLRGESPPHPEMSTLGVFNIPQRHGGISSGGWLIPKGTLIVNPTDNSILYKPNG